MHLPSTAFSSSLLIGNVGIRNRVALAPMSGVTDLPFRRLAWRFGAGFVVTEMVASRELVGNASESWARLKNSGIEPHVVQLAGREAHWMAEAARIVEANGADIIDINMGCPAKKVTGGYSGSALMRNPDHALSLIEATVKAATVPVTLKMRLGWDENSINAPLIARRAEDAGVKAITIHGRTRMQFYNGKADWDAIRAVREVVSVPLIANGDVDSVADVQEILRRSGADAVMVGRSCQGRPWHAGVLAGAAAHPDASGIAQIFAEHYEMMLEFYGVEVGLRTARKHAGWYLDRFAPELPASEKAAFLTSTDTDFVRDGVVAAIARSGEAAAREEIAA
ncbi:tRNA dihydrouridine synthase DusB [Mesorhizobium plurifarium]|nr:tRNA dihydrouridine synthase DusB [Mesorhizobium plurifarium]